MAWQARAAAPPFFITATSPNLATTRVLTLIALAAALASADARPPLAFPKDKKPPKPLPYRAVGAWGVRSLGRPVNVHWQCTPFRLEAEDDDHLADIRMTIAAQRGAGPVNAKVIRRQDATNLAKKRDRARVSATVKGMGVAYFKLSLELTDEASPAGLYGSVVDVTVTSL